MPRAGWAAMGAVVVALAAAGGRAMDPSMASVGALAGLLLGSIIGLAVRRTNRGGALALVVVAIVVAVRVCLAPGGQASPVGAIDAFGSGSGPWLGRVVGVGSPRDGQQVATLEVMPAAGPDAAGPGASDGANEPAPAGPSSTDPTPGAPTIRVAATLPRYPTIRPGLTVATRGRLQPLSDDDYGRYLAGIGVDATLRATELSIVGDTGGAGSTIEAVRRAGDDALARALPEPQAGLASGILIGLRDRVDRDLAAAFTAAGVSHVVAISGWNIAIVGAVIAAMLRSWPRRRRAVATLLAIGGYTILTGASASVLRAAAMATVVLLARETGRTGRAAAALGWAIVGLVVAGPTLITDPGFALSAAATGGLIAWATPLTRRFQAWRGGRLPGWLCESFGVSLAAEFATLPIALAWFGRVPIVAPAVNLLVVPLVAPAMAAGGVALAGGSLAAAGMPAALATVLGLPAWIALTAVIVIVRAAAALPFASATLDPPVNIVAAALAGAAVLWVVLVRGGRWRLPRLSWRRPARRRARATTTARPDPRLASPAARSTGGQRPARRHVGAGARIVAAALATAVLGVGAVALTRPDGRVRITVLDVGQGDAILVDADRGARMLVDGGPDPDRLLVALDAHVPAWDRRIDLLVLTHPHEDHVAGMALLLQRYRVARIVEPGMRGPGPGYRAWAAELAAEGKSTGRLATGDAFGLDDIRFSVLWPDREAVPAEPTDTGTGINNVSIVLLGTFGQERFLLAGDIEEGIDPILLARGLPRVDFLKVAHHGSRTSSSGPFLDAVRPRIAAVSAGAGNPYGHPAPATLDRLREHRAQVFRTDLDGTVDVTLDGQGATARSEGGRSRATTGRPGTRTRAWQAATIKASTPGDDVAVRFRCGIPRPVGGPSAPVAEAAPAAPPPSAPLPPVPPSAPAATSPSAPPMAVAVAVVRRASIGGWSGTGGGPSPTAGLYHRVDDGPRAGRRRRPPPLPRSPALGAAPCTRGRRGRRLARAAYRRTRDGGGPAPRGGGGPAP